MESRSKTFIVLTVILVGVVVVLGATIVYLINNPTTVYQISERTGVEEKNSGESIETNTQTNTNTNTNITTTTMREMTADERYAIYINGLKNNLKTIGKYGDTFDEDRFEPYFIYDGYILEFDGVNHIELKNNGDVYAQLSSNSYLGKKYGNTYKIGSNIVRVGVTKYGQDGDMIFMINSNGKFYCCILSGSGADSEENSLEFKEVTKLKNIVNVENLDRGEAIVPFAIDIDGNIFELSN